MLPINTIIIKTQTAEILQQWTTGDHVTTHALKHHYWPSTIRPFDLKSNQIDPCLKYENCMRYGCLEGASGNIQKAPGPINRIELYMNQMVDTNKCKQYTEISCQVRWPLAVSLRIKLPSPPMQQHIPSLDNHLQPHCFFWMGKIFWGKTDIPPRLIQIQMIFYPTQSPKSWHGQHGTHQYHWMCILLVGSFWSDALIVNCLLWKKNTSIFHHIWQISWLHIGGAKSANELTLKKKCVSFFFYTCS